MTQPRYPYVHVAVPADEAEWVSEQLWTFGAQGIEERDDTTLLHAESDGGVLLIASFPDEAGAHRALAQLAHPGRIEFIVGDDWKDAWREHFHPRKVGSRLLLRPSWREVEPEAGDVVLTIDPGSAFGSGIHETTRLVLAEVDRCVKGGERVLDVGCGSGILSVAALLLGAESAIAIDVDPLAVTASDENAERNGVANKLDASTKHVSTISGEFELVLANIQAPILIAMAGELTDRLKANGTLILSGILEGQEADVNAAFPKLQCESIPQEGEWRAIVLKH